MTLKKCTLRQLDDTFWRVDWEGPAAEARTANCTLTANSPSIAERDGDSWFFCGIWSQSLAEALSRFALTIEDPKPETAEERVIDDAFTPDREGWSYLSGRVAESRVRRACAIGSPGDLGPVAGVTLADLRAILAELDLYRDGNRVLMERHKELHAQISNLTAQRPVDVEAVLAPIRIRLAALEQRASGLASSRDAHIANQPGTSPNYIEAGIAEVERWSLMVTANSLRDAIAEAEKIGRGQ